MYKSVNCPFNNHCFSYRLGRAPTPAGCSSESDSSDDEAGSRSRPAAASKAPTPATASDTKTKESVKVVEAEPKKAEMSNLLAKAAEKIEEQSGDGLLIENVSIFFPIETNLNHYH